MTASTWTTQHRVASPDHAYDWGRNAIAIDIAKESVLATRAALVGRRTGRAAVGGAGLSDVTSAIEQVDLQQNSVRVIGQEQKAATDRFEVGEITQTDVAQADAALAAARASLASAEGRSGRARILSAGDRQDAGQTCPAAADAQTARQSGSRARYRRSAPTPRSSRHAVRPPPPNWASPPPRPSAIPS